MSEKHKLPEDRFLIRPDIDPADSEAVDELATGITGWILKQRAKVQAAAKGTVKSAGATRPPASSSAPPVSVPMVAKGRS